MVEAGEEYNPDYRDDEEIAEDVLALLEEDPRVDHVDIDVKVDRGTVKLSGSVESGEEAEMAEALAQRVDGVIDVVNELYVVGSSRTEAPWPGRDAPQEEELEGIEVAAGDREATENYIASVEEGLPYIPPDEPEFPVERDAAFELRRREISEQRARERRRRRKRETDKVEGQEL